MKVIVLFIAAAGVCFWLSGCASADKLRTPDGQIGYSVSCNGAMLDWGACYEKAGEICGARGYEVFSKSDSKGATYFENQFSAYGGTAIYRNMVIACKTSKHL